jgi:hypothetical protein
MAEKTEKTALCRYGCGEPPHTPADACLTAGQKVGRMFGVTMIYVLAIGLLIGLVLWWASTRTGPAPVLFGG